MRWGADGDGSTGYPAVWSDVGKADVSGTSFSEMEGTTGGIDWILSVVRGRGSCIGMRRGEKVTGSEVEARPTTVIRRDDR